MSKLTKLNYRPQKQLNLEHHILFTTTSYRYQNTI